MPFSCDRRLCGIFSVKSSSGEDSVVVAVCAAVESDIAEVNDADRVDFMAEPGLNRVIRAGHEMLSLQTYFTAGGKKCARETSLSMRLCLRRLVRSTSTSRRLHPCTDYRV